MLRQSEIFAIYLHPKSKQGEKSGTEMAVRCRPPLQTRKPKPLAEVMRRKDKAFSPISSLSKQKFKYI
jgi:hypothetical protein